jgi:putative hydrolase of the HAD superfamily
VTAADSHLEAWLAAEQRHFPAWRSRRITFAEQRRRRLRDFLPVIGLRVGSDAELDQVFAGYLSCYEAAWTAFDDVDAALGQLHRRGVRVAVLTNGTVEQQHAKLTRVGLAGRVGPVVTAEELTAGKPDPGAYLAVCRRLELPPQDVLHVGDLHDLDVLAPRAAGLRAVHLDRLDQGPHDEQSRITSLRDLDDHLGGAQGGPGSVSRAARDSR